MRLLLKIGVCLMQCILGSAKFLTDRGDLKMSYDNILELAKMANNVYINHEDTRWMNVSLEEVYDMSIKDDSLRVFLFRGDNTNVIAIKGTSLYWSLKRERCKREDINVLSTYYNDKYNDNLYFSCCYYKQSNLFNKCDSCEEEKRGECCKECYKRSENIDDNYLKIGSEIVENIKKKINFDKDEVLFVGHSLGGGVASLLAVKYNKVGVAFQSPGDRHYMDMIGMDYKDKKVYHFGHDGDPIYTGECGSTCYMLGYNIYTKCHIGNTCMYNAKEKLNIGSSLWNHRIGYVIDYIISKWEEDMPSCIKELDCNECEDWKYN
jgi:putative lipase involved disintegration of autophagic bodies